jgi:hypothetical protein
MELLDIQIVTCSSLNWSASFLQINGACCKFSCTAALQTNVKNHQFIASQWVHVIIAMRGWGSIQHFPRTLLLLDCSPASSVAHLHCRFQVTPDEMSSMRQIVRKMNFSSMTTPAVLGAAQSAATTIGKTEIAAAARWGGAVGLIAFWFIEPYDFIAGLRGSSEDTK